MKGLTWVQLRLIERELVWRNILNFRSTREYRRYRPNLCTEGVRLLEALNETGLAITHVDRIPGMAEMFEALRNNAQDVEARLAQRAQRKHLAGSRRSGYTFASNLLGSFPRFDPASIFARFSTHPALLEVINGYFGLFAQLRKYAVFRTTDVTEGVNAKWHRDALFDIPIIRVFAYFADVTEKNGALLYARGTHTKSKEGSRRAIADEILDRQAASCVGSEGSIVLADTRGYHKAGSFSVGERWLYNSVFTTPGYGADYFTRVQRTKPERMQPVSWALSSPLSLTRNFFY